MLFFNRYKLLSSVAVVLPTALLSACGTQTTANRIIQSHYIGKHTDSFFTDHGPARQSQDLASGDKVYIWSSGIDSYSGISVECRVKIQADENHSITGISVQGDSVGKWEWSRCHEIFKEWEEVNGPT